MDGAGSIVVVGSMNIDMVAYCDRFPEDGETLVGSSYAQGFGGKGANQAVMAARLGATTRFVGCVGDDDLGRATIDNLDESGIDVSGIGVLAGHGTGVAPIWVNRDGTNRILIIPGANDALTPDHVTSHLAGLDRAAVVVGQLETPQDATLAAFEWARSHGATKVLNPAPAADLDDRLLAATDWLIPNETEFALLTGDAPTEAAVERWAQEWGCGFVVTLGADGVIVADGSNAPWREAARQVRVVDTTGAGDAFVGGFAAGLAAGMLIRGCVSLGGACGSLSTTRQGTQSSYPDRAEVADLGVSVPVW
ncbi:MAG: ribokinase [Acidimicrobiia bacterium]